MDIDIQLQVTDRVLKEFPEYPTHTTSSPTDQTDTRLPAEQFPVLKEQTLIQPSVHLTYGKQTLVHPRVPSTQSMIILKQSLVQPRAPPPLLLTLQSQPNLLALVGSLTPQAQRYICIGVHLSCQVSQPGLSSRPSVMDLTKDGKRGEREGTPKERLGKGGTSSGICRHDDME